MTQLPMRAVHCTAKASYKKASGLLELTDTHLQWTQDGRRAPSVRVAHAQAASLFCSKEGAAQVKLKLGLVDDETGHNFTFISPQPIAYTERERFKKELTTIISRNRSGTTDIVAKPPITAFASLPPSNAPTPRALPPTPHPSTSRAASVSSDGRSTVILGNDPAREFHLRKKILLSNPSLGALHRELVITGPITEAEFWDGREHLLLAEAAAEGQRKGKPGQLVDPRPETVEGGEIKIRITPQLVHDIFDEYPVVAKAYSDNVPSKLSEEEFWKRYFQSKLFNAHRASIRSSATQHVVKDDPIFDKYLERDDDELEPRRQREEIADIFVDLLATREDHEETGNEKDVTMQAGRQRAALPLMRKFNEHSERLLNSALGGGPPVKRQRTDATDGSDGGLAAIDLDDLYDPQASADIVLEMQGRQRYFEGRMSGSGSTSAEDAARKSLDISAMILESKDNLNQWENHLAQLNIERKPSDSALLAMTQNVAARLDAKTRKNVLPQPLLRKMTSCQTATNEFLRQFWSSVYPPPAELQTVGVATPAQRASKAARMISYLAKTQEKVDALVQGARSEGINSTPVEIGMRPLLDAVDRALEFYRNRKPPRT